jgi:hypothetical protein
MVDALVDRCAAAMAGVCPQAAVRGSPECPASWRKLMAERTDDDRAKRALDPGAYIGNEPELEAETIPGGVEPGDERVAAYDSRPGLPEEPTGDSPSEDASRQGPGG